jgi:predicted house-cleaning noncanonical NTP pyrophosphatase (MazG superfamily)
MPTYNKLVRDFIPEVIARAGKTCTTEKIEGQEYKKALQKKLQEEVKEYLHAQTNEEAEEELADILEVIHALTAVHDSSIEKIEAVRERKAKERGGFTEGIVLLEVKE